MIQHCPIHQLKVNHGCNFAYMCHGAKVYENYIMYVQCNKVYKIIVKTYHHTFSKAISES
jgi:hypothetical protein